VGNFANIDPLQKNFQIKTKEVMALQKEKKKPECGTAVGVAILSMTKIVNSKHMQLESQAL